MRSTVPKEPFLTPRSRSLRPKRMRSWTAKGFLPAAVEICSLTRRRGRPDGLAWRMGTLRTEGDARRGAVDLFAS